jgi:hypothetical protein
MTPLCVFFNAFTGHKMRVHHITAPGILVIWAVTHPSTNRALTLLDFDDQMGTGMSNVARRRSNLAIFKTEPYIKSYSCIDLRTINLDFDRQFKNSRP